MSVSTLTAEAHRTRTRPQLNLFGIGLRLSGLAGTWTAVANAGLFSAAPADALWLVAAVTWLVLCVRYAHGVTLRGLGGDLHDPVLGPFAALVPTTGLLLGGRLESVQREVGQGFVLAMGVAAAAFGIWFFSHLLRGGLDIDAMHSGYLLPTAAATLIGVQSLALAGWPGGARAAFAVGLLSWLVLGPLLVARFAFRPDPPTALVPTFAIFSAPPAVAGDAWFALSGPCPDLLEQALLGCFVLLIGVQLLKVPSYLRLPFALGWWALTFTTAASAAFVCSGRRRYASPAGGWSPGWPLRPHPSQSGLSPFAQSDWWSTPGGRPNVDAGG